MEHIAGHIALDDDKACRRVIAHEHVREMLGSVGSTDAHPATSVATARKLVAVAALIGSCRGLD
jgi:hypothetical protein